MKDLSKVPGALMKRPGKWSEIARLAGVNYYTVQRIAKGKTANPGIRTLRKIAEAIEAVPERAARAA